MKNIIYSVFLALGISMLSSCEYMLEEDVRNQISNEHLNTALGLEDGVNAAYSYLRSFYGIQNGGWLTVFGTDEFLNGNADPAYATYSANINSRSGVVSGPWGKFYEAINTCNAVIERGQQVQGMDEILKNTRIAEARFLRAHYYFLLVQIFGPVHITLEETIGASRVATRARIEEVYQVIIDDMEAAIPNLPATPSEYGRATVHAAKHQLAKVYLTRAGSTAAQPGDYAKAAELAEDVINDPGNHRLLDDFADIYRVGNEVNDEVLFAVQYSNVQLLNEDGNNAHMFYTCAYDNQPGMYRDLANGRPWAHYRPTEFMLGLFDEEDSRDEKSFQRVWYCNKPGTFTIDGRSITLALGDTALYITDREYTDEERARANYKIVAPSQYTNTLFPSLTKYLDPNRPNINDAGGTRDFVVYRLADTYLLAAEALLMSGKEADALPYINAVRRRAARVGATPAETEANRQAMEVTASDLNIDFILDERARELSGEYMRWFDLKRTNKLLERVRLHNPQAEPNIQEYHMVRPIPQTQIDRTEGGADAFPQNPGYN